MNSKKKSIGILLIVLLCIFTGCTQTKDAPEKQEENFKEIDETIKEIDISTWYNSDRNCFLPGGFPDDITVDEVIEQLEIDLTNERNIIGDSQTILYDPNTVLILGVNGSVYYRFEEGRLIGAYFNADVSDLSDSERYILAEDIQAELEELFGSPTNSKSYSSDKFYEIDKIGWTSKWYKTDVDSEQTRLVFSVSPDSVTNEVLISLTIQKDAEKYA